MQRVLGISICDRSRMEEKDILFSLYHIYFGIQCIWGKIEAPLTPALAPGASIRENTVDI